MSQLKSRHYVQSLLLIIPILLFFLPLIVGYNRTFYLFFLVSMLLLFGYGLIRAHITYSQLYAWVLVVAIGLFSTLYVPPLNPAEGYQMQVANEPVGPLRILPLMQSFIDHQPFEYVIYGWQDDMLYYASRPTETTGGTLGSGQKNWRFDPKTGELREVDTTPLSKYANEQLSRDAALRLFAEGQADPTNWYINQIKSPGYISPSGDYTAVLVKYILYGPQAVVILEKR